MSPSPPTSTTPTTHAGVVPPDSAGVPPSAKRLRPYVRIRPPNPVRVPCASQAVPPRAKGVPPHAEEVTPKPEPVSPGSCSVAVAQSISTSKVPPDLNALPTAAQPNADGYPLGEGRNVLIGFASGDDPFSGINVQTTAFASELETYRKDFNIPEDILVQIPSPTDVPSRPPEGFTPIHIESLRCGLRLPLHPFLQELLSTFGLHAFQLNSSSYRCIAGLFSLWHQAGHGALSVAEFCHRFMLIPNKSMPGSYYFKNRTTFRYVKGIPSKYRNWEYEWVFVSEHCLVNSPLFFTVSIVGGPPLVKEVEKVEARFATIRAIPLGDRQVSRLILPVVFRASGWFPVSESTTPVPIVAVPTINNVPLDMWGRPWSPPPPHNSDEGDRLKASQGSAFLDRLPLPEHKRIQDKDRFHVPDHRLPVPKHMPTLGQDLSARLPPSISAGWRNLGVSTSDAAARDLSSSLDRKATNAATPFGSSPESSQRNAGLLPPVDRDTQLSSRTACLYDTVYRGFEAFCSVPGRLEEVDNLSSDCITQNLFAVTAYLVHIKELRTIEQEELRMAIAEKENLARKVEKLNAEMEEGVKAAMASAEEMLGEYKRKLEKSETKLKAAEAERSHHHLFMMKAQRDFFTEENISKGLRKELNELRNSVAAQIQTAKEQAVVDFRCSEEFKKEYWEGVYACREQTIASNPGATLVFPFLDGHEGSPPSTATEPPNVDQDTPFTSEALNNHANTRGDDA